MDLFEAGELDEADEGFKERFVRSTQRLNDELVAATPGAIDEGQTASPSPPVRGGLCPQKTRSGSSSRPARRTASTPSSISRTCSFTSGRKGHPRSTISCRRTGRVPSGTSALPPIVRADRQTGERGRSVPTTLPRDKPSLGLFT